MGISAVIPVYNANKTIRRCVDSLLPQLGREDEIILINDGSTDGSAGVCAEYAQSDPRIRFIDKPNGGVSSARNAGLDAAQGKFVIFVDSDDYVGPTLFTEIETLQQEADWDLISFSHAIDSGSSVEQISTAIPRTLEIMLALQGSDLQG